MTDRELLELAAKAAGFADAAWAAEQACISTLKLPGFRCFWNPLTDDGDALALAVQLKVDVFFHTSRVEAHVAGGRLPPIRCIAREEFNNDPYTATRRAIVRAAAEIGRNKND